LPYRVFNKLIDLIIFTTPGKLFARVVKKINSYLQAKINHRAEQNRNNRIASYFIDLTVKGGLFSGMKYASLESVGSQIFPKLAGTYEDELFPMLKLLSSNQYDLIVNIGHAEGFYAIGLAKLFPTNYVYAYDIDAHAEELCTRMALLNNVQDRVLIKGSCSAAILANITMGKRCLILCDCEGYERELFVKSNITAFADSHLIIELHPMDDALIKSYVTDLFNISHDLQFVSSHDTVRKIFELPNEFSIFSFGEKYKIVDEHRPFTMDWLIASPRYLN